MDYQNYDEYMRNVLNYNSGGYSPYPANYYSIPKYQRVANQEELHKFYPEIYTLLYPMVCKACNRISHREITKELLDEVTNDIYMNFEPETAETTTAQVRAPLKNGDVRNPNAKEPEETKQATRQSNFLLKDLIRILLIRELIKQNRQTPYNNQMPQFMPRQQEQFYDLYRY